jgi:hypothetical protein
MPTWICCLQLQGTKLFFPEGGSIRVFRNYIFYIPNYTASIPITPLSGFGHFMIGKATDLPVLDYVSENST